MYVVPRTVCVDFVTVLFALKTCAIVDEIFGAEMVWFGVTADKGEIIKIRKGRLSNKHLKNFENKMLYVQEVLTHFI